MPGRFWRVAVIAQWPSNAKVLNARSFCTQSLYVPFTGPCVEPGASNVPQFAASEDRPRTTCTPCVVGSNGATPRPPRCRTPNFMVLGMAACGTLPGFGRMGTTLP
mmetsp:Transcript_4006/g.7200  ORF Transcript_4006/g.7200 Transcript_4006/m.7200 type:complete len:106 (+) Transcript_4006:43-360(+)